MPDPNDPPQSQTTYPIDAENAAEMARLFKQGQLITRMMGALFPESADASNIHDVLDIACGPGGWVLDVARAYPHLQVTGVDISQLMTAYATSEAGREGLTNVQFRVMDALKPLEFPDHSFDLVNARLLFAFIPKVLWPTLLQECKRITRPGGFIRLTEAEEPMTNIPACEKVLGMLAHAFHLAGLSFSPDGRHIRMIPMLGYLLRSAGYQKVQTKAYRVDFSAGMDSHEGIYQDLRVVFKLAQPFLIKMGVTTQSEIDGLYHRAMEEMQSEDFCGLWLYLSAWGQKLSDQS